MVGTTYIHRTAADFCSPHRDLQHQPACTWHLRVISHLVQALRVHSFNKRRVHSSGCPPAPAPTRHVVDLLLAQQALCPQRLHHLPALVGAVHIMPMWCTGRGHLSPCFFTTRGPSEPPPSRHLSSIGTSCTRLLALGVLAQVANALSITGSFVQQVQV